MSTSTTLEPPAVDHDSEDPDTKYELVRTGTGPLPYAGSRRFSRMWMRVAVDLDSSYDARVSSDQSAWTDRDITTQEEWDQWAGR